MQHFSPELPPLPDRRPTSREERTHTSFPVVIERDDGRRFEAIVTNVSASGIGMKSTVWFEPSQRVCVIKPGYGRFRCEVRWAEGENLGLFFSEPINLAELCAATQVADINDEFSQ